MVLVIGDHVILIRPSVIRRAYPDFSPDQRARPRNPLAVNVERGESIAGDRPTSMVFPVNKIICPIEDNSMKELILWRLADRKRRPDQRAGCADELTVDVFVWRIAT